MSKKINFLFMIFLILCSNYINFCELENKNKKKYEYYIMHLIYHASYIIKLKNKENRATLIKSH